MKSALIFVRIFLLIFITGLILLSFSNVKSTYASNSTSLNYTALGDSITIATVGIQGQPFNDGTPVYVDRYKDYVSADLSTQVNKVNLGINGLTSGGLLGKLTNDQNYRNSVKNSKLITIMIGVNDYHIARSYFYSGICGGTDNQNCLRNAVNIFNNNFTNIISEIKSINQNPNTVILISDFYNPYIRVDIDAGNQSILVPYIAQMNNFIHTASSNNGIGVANVYQAYNGSSGLEDPVAKGYLFDIIHPSGAGHEVIASQFKAFNPSLLDKDFDGDGFSNRVEKRMTTDMLASCPISTSHNAWPPDTDNTGKVLVADILLESQKYRTNIPRYDFDGDGMVLVADILKVRDYYSRTCPQ